MRGNEKNLFNLFCCYPKKPVKNEGVKFLDISGTEQRIHDEELAWKALDKLKLSLEQVQNLIERFRDSLCRKENRLQKNKLSSEPQVVTLKQRLNAYRNYIERLTTCAAELKRDIEQQKASIKRRFPNSKKGQFVSEKPGPV